MVVNFFLLLLFLFLILLLFFSHLVFLFLVFSVLVSFYLWCFLLLLPRGVLPLLLLDVFFLLLLSFFFLLLPLFSFFLIKSVHPLYLPLLARYELICFYIKDSTCSFSSKYFLLLYQLYDSSYLIYLALSV